MGFLMGFSINFYGFSASRYVMTALDELHIIPPGEFNFKDKRLQVIPLEVFFNAVTAF